MQQKLSNEQTKPVHSPLGASSAERWMNCPGSVSLIKVLAMPETDEPEYRALGIAAHELAAVCLREGQDTWELIGEKFHNQEVDKEMADAVQVYLDTVRPDMGKPGAKVYIEHGVSHPSINFAYGTVDSGVVYEDIAVISDYKHGEGIVVEVKDNPQLMYYAFLFLFLHPEVQRVLLRIVQPRAYAQAVREWPIEAFYIKQWAAETLIPAMDLAQLEGGDLDAGNWCRFCPAKLVCPLMGNLFGAAMTANPKEVVELTDESIGRSYGYIQAVKFYIKALEEEVFNRLNRGSEIPGCKLVPKKANRVFKPGASALMAAKFGEDAFIPADYKTPAEIDKLGATGKAFTREYAYTPQTGLTFATADDPRPAVKVQSSQEAFGSIVQALTDNK